MKLYHGTQAHIAREIEDTQYFEPSEPSGFTPMECGSVVFFTDKIEWALEYGDGVIEIESEGLETFYQICPLTGIYEYYIEYNEVNELLFSRIQ